MKKLISILLCLSFFLISSSSLFAQDDPIIISEEYVLKPKIITTACETEGNLLASLVSFNGFCSTATDSAGAVQDYIDNRIEKKLNRLINCSPCDESDEQCNLIFQGFADSDDMPEPSTDVSSCEKPNSNYSFPSTRGKPKYDCSTCYTPLTDPDITFYTDNGISMPDELPSENKGVLNLYPNPASQYITVDLMLEKNSPGSQMVIFDLSGRAIMQIQLGEYNSGDHQEMVDISELEPGIYFFSFYSKEDKMDTVRFIVTE